eukprot:CAMPEP_0116035088 /NCGR_PEP_ID=MMETSP0321-20121206/20090_1 /TAXON_ID=163516 /ORGANISM="Leptocylindrus danicus var. danicus, Strain B650" /LENGTH=77 /DNA_ID=CAMNT_0003511715 /DNA_START=67 /DNA_END=297 /DNA_ORIENTATION=-
MEERVDVGPSTAAELFQHNPIHQREAEFAYGQIRRSKQHVATKSRNYHRIMEKRLGGASRKNFNSSADSEFLPASNS